MPVKIPDRLPAVQILVRENISVIPERRAFAQDIRPLRVAILNIMPNKTATETQLLRLLSKSPLQVAITLLHPKSHRSKNTAGEHLLEFYKNFDDVKDEKFDCLIITGAPVETIPFADVVYWVELQRIMDWSRTHVFSTLHLCWGAQAGLNHHHGIEKYTLGQKMFGVFSHRITTPSALLQGFDDTFFAPHSRHTDVRRDDIARSTSLRILSESSTAGVYIVSAYNDRQIFITGHPEYDQLTLKDEYDRDLAKRLPVICPANYFPDDDPSCPPVVRWRGHASLLFANWLNLVYQQAPFNLNDLEPLL